MTGALRIAFLQPTVHGGGAERAAAAWMEHGARAGHHVALLTFADGAYDAHRRSPLPHGVRHHRAPAAGGGRLAAGVARAWWVRRRCRALRADVLVANLSYANLLALAAFPSPRRRTAVVLVEQNPASVLLAGEGWPGRAKRLAARRWYRRADAVVAISHAVAADAMSGMGIERRRVWVLAPPVTGAGADGARPAPPQRVELLFVGRLVPQKQPALVVAALAALRARGVDARGTFIGAGPLEPELRAQAARARVPCAFLGWVESWTAEAQRRSSTAVLLLPSAAEGLGFVLIEAARAGIPVVAPSQALGVGDAIVPGVTGTLALSDRPEHLVEAVLDAAAGLSAPELAGWYRWFDAPSSGRRLLDILDTVLRERAR